MEDLNKKEKFEIGDIITHNNVIGEIVGIDLTKNRYYGGRLWVRVALPMVKPPPWMHTICWLRNNCSHIKNKNIKNCQCNMQTLMSKGCQCNGT